MKKLFILFLFSIILLSSVNAESVYVIDNNANIEKGTFNVWIPALGINSHTMFDIDRTNDNAFVYEDYKGTYLGRIKVKKDNKVIKKWRFFDFY